jgi:DNA polymerase zeta
MIAHGSIIMDRSSVSISPFKPFNDNLSTPTKTHPPSDKVTPNSMLRNMFAKNRPSYSPHTSPSKPPVYPSANTVVLTPSKRSVKGWQSPSPEPEDRSEGSPTPTKIKASMTHTFQEVKQELKEIQASEEMVDMPGGQQVRSSKSSGESHGKPPTNGGVKREMSPTLRNDDPFQATANGGTMAGQDDTPRATKRVRMASPDLTRASQLVSSQTLLPTPPRLSLSQISAQSHPTDDSSSTVPSNLSSTAWTYHLHPPSRQQIGNTMEENGVDSVIYTEPHYSNRSDIPPRAKMFAGRMFTLRGNGVKEMGEFESSFGGLSMKGKGRAGKVKRVGQYGWEYAPLPPRPHTVLAWCDKEDELEAERRRSLQVVHPIKLIS